LIYLNDNKDWIIKTKFNPKKTIDYVDSLVREINSDLNGKSTNGLNSKQYDLFNSNIDPLNKIMISILEKQFDNFSFLNVSAWTVCGEEYGYHSIHQHSDEGVQDICTVSYLKTPQEINPHLSGNIFFIMRDSLNKINIVDLSPKEGDIYIFPCHVFHGTYPQSKGLRQTLNLDYRVTFK
jgi:hypothetical protein